MSSYLIPIIILSILINGIVKHQDIYNDFLVGAKDGLKTVFNITPSILAMIFAINVFLQSGLINAIANTFSNVLNNIPVELISMAILRPISGTASLSILNSIFKLYGPDSFFGLLASTMQGCTDTTIYVLALYFGSINVTKSKYALGVGLFADAVGIMASIIIVSIFFK
jgi:spore maturation protein B